MFHIFFITTILTLSLFGKSEVEFSDEKHKSLIKKGKKVALNLCDKNLLLKIDKIDNSKVLKQIISLKACTKLHKRNSHALVYYLTNSGHKTHKQLTIKPPKHSKCPVCGMFVAKYPKWAAVMKVSSDKYYFDGVKDMMKYYIFDVDFPYNRDDISIIKVTDFYTLHAIDAKKAYYVVWSDIYGPMGNELIPFKSKKSAHNFLKDHRGKKILKFNEITPALIMELDGLEY